MNKTLKDLRLEKGVLQRDVAEAVGASTQAVSNWESGGMPAPSKRTKLARYYGLSISELLDVLRETRRQAAAEMVASAAR